MTFYAKKCLICLIIGLSFIFGGLVFASENETKVFIDGQEVAFDVQPTMIQDRTMVPVRSISEATGLSVDWHETYVGYNVVGIYQNTRQAQIAVKLPNDGIIYPVSFCSNAIYDLNNGTYYLNDSIIFLLSSLNSGYRILGSDSDNKRVSLAMPHYSFCGDSYSDTIFVGEISENSNNSYSLDTTPGNQKGGAIMFEDECMVPIDKILDFYGVKYNKIWFDEQENQIIIDLLPSDKLVEIKE